MDSPVCTFTGEGESGTLITGSEGEVCATEGEEVVVIDDGEDERDVELFACRDDDNDTDDNAVEESLLDGM